MNSSVKRLLGALLLIATIGLSSVLAIRGANAVESADQVDTIHHAVSDLHG